MSTEPDISVQWVADEARRRAGCDLQLLALGDALTYFSAALHNKSDQWIIDALEHHTHPTATENITVAQ